MGQMAQEESISRRSPGLYPCQPSMPGFPKIALGYNSSAIKPSLSPVEEIFLGHVAHVFQDETIIA
jgi:hypothetical protein